MKRVSAFWFCLSIVWLCGSVCAEARDVINAGKPRLVVLTDISNEPDDEESLVRLLVYSNEFDIEALIATTSVWLRDQVRPDLLKRTIEAYGSVRQNLLLHAPGYPETERLLSAVKAGRPEFGMTGVGEGKRSEGSDWIIKVVDAADARPVWIAVWGGTNCLAQALWDVKATRSASEVNVFIGKLRVYAISDQDDSGYWIRRTFPNLFYLVSPTTVNDEEYHTATWSGISGDRLHRNGPMEHFDLVDNPWLDRNIRQGHGRLGELYPKFEYLMEGDTPSFLNLIGNGLAASENPGWGGWGGRYVLRQPHGESRPIWTNSRDTVVGSTGVSYTSNQATIWRWREAYQNDFAARMDWCIAEPKKANHNPHVVVNGVEGRGVVRMSGRPGDHVAFSAEGTTDPDGDALSYRWFYYPEAGSPSRNPDSIPLENGASARMALTLPEGAWTELHFIVEVRDHGTPNLFSYRRIIVERSGAR
jgi:hypothetical protein